MVLLSFNLLQRAHRLRERLHRHPIQFALRGKSPLCCVTFQGPSCAKIETSPFLWLRCGSAICPIEIELGNANGDDGGTPLQS